MFYCDKCAEKYTWPVTLLYKSYGTCETCGAMVQDCNDTPWWKLSAIPDDSDNSLEDDEFAGWDDDPGYW